MKRLSIMCTLILFMSQMGVTAQDQLPEAVKSAFPAKYKLVMGFFNNEGDIANASISLETPSKFGCGSDKNSYPPASIGINVNIINDAEYAQMMEQATPFSIYWPNKDSHKPDKNSYGSELVTYSETTTFDLPDGQAAYYTYTRKCIQDAHEEMYGVSMVSVSGNYSRKVTLGVSGHIDAAEAIAILKEIHGIISKIDFLSL